LSQNFKVEKELFAIISEDAIISLFSKIIINLFVYLLSSTGIPDFSLALFEKQSGKSTDFKIYDSLLLRQMLRIILL